MKWISLVLGALVALASIGSYWWDRRQVEQAKDDLREIGVSEQDIDEIVEFAEDVDPDQIDGNDDVITGEELAYTRIALEMEPGAVDSSRWTDDELRQIIRDSCAVVEQSETQIEFMVESEVTLRPREEFQSLTDEEFGYVLGTGVIGCEDEFERLGF